LQIHQSNANQNGRSKSCEKIYMIKTKSHIKSKLILLSESYLINGENY
jgi:hypothetical protein